MMGVGFIKDFVGVLRVRMVEIGYLVLIVEVKKVLLSCGVI